ncbi:MAG: DUF883 family protein [Burkholderiales bacterium]
MESTTTTSSSTPSASARSSERVLEVLKASVDDAEALLREAAGATGDRAAELRDRAMKSLRATRETLHETQDIVLEQGRRAARVTDDYVHDNPWQAVAAAGLAGLLLGLVLSGRR